MKPYKTVVKYKNIWIDWNTYKTRRSAEQGMLDLYLKYPHFTAVKVAERKTRKGDDSR